MLNNDTKTEVIKLAHLPDSTFVKNLNEVQRYNFKKQKVDVVNLAYTSIPHWFAFSYYNENAKNRFYLAIENSMLDSIEVYFVANDKLIKTFLGGDFHPYFKREIDNPDFFIRLPDIENSVIDVYVRIRSEVNLLAPIKIYSEKNAFSKINNISVGLGIYYGALLVIFFYSLFLFFRLKDISYIYYVLFILTYGLSLFNFDGYFFKYFAPTDPYFNNLVLYVFIYGATIFGTLFTISYLDLKKNWRFGYYMISSLMAPLILAGLLVFIFPDIMLHDMIASVASAIISLVGIVAGIVVWKRGNPTAQYYVIAYTFMLTSVIIFVFKDLGALPSNDFTEYVMHYGSGLEMILLSLGLADRYNRLQKANVVAQKEIIKGLENIQHVQEKANAELEQKVKDRTIEIIHQKELIEEKSKEIIDSITYAKRIQSAILPPKYLFNHYLTESFILYLPKDIVAGDFYWLEVKNTTDELGIEKPMIFFAAADCTGHGVPGAMVSVICNNALNRAVREFGLFEPNKILDKTNEIIGKEFEKSTYDIKDGMDISLCSLEYHPTTKNGIETRVLNWSGANNPLWIFRRNEKTNEIDFIEYKPNKQPIGRYINTQPFDLKTIEVFQNDTLYLFTDGYQDQFGGEKGKKFKASQLKDLLISINSLSMIKQNEILNQTIQEWKGSLEQIDDICIIGVRL